MKVTVGIEVQRLGTFLGSGPETFEEESFALNIFNKAADVNETGFTAFTRFIWIQRKIKVSIGKRSF